jgi:hypothetical protein
MRGLIEIRGTKVMSYDRSIVCVAILVHLDGRCILEVLM